MKQYIVDAFTDKVFSGNPAAVCVMDSWPSDELMQKIAMENNLSETAFAVKEGGVYRLRWFTPALEVGLCGHATLAASHVILTVLEPAAEQVVYHTAGGTLTVRRKDGGYEMDFPAYGRTPIPVSPAITGALGAVPREAYMADQVEMMCIFDDEAVVRSLSPDLEKIRALDALGVHVTAPGREVDCVSRTFAPKCGIPEDPVCGSAHCYIVPYWAERTGKTAFTAFQASKRGGLLHCRLEGDRIALGGRAALFSAGEIFPV